MYGPAGVLRDVRHVPAHEAGQLGLWHGRYAVENGLLETAIIGGTVGGIFVAGMESVLWIRRFMKDRKVPPVVKRSALLFVIGLFSFASWNAFHKAEEPLPPTAEEADKRESLDYIVSSVAAEEKRAKIRETIAVSAYVHAMLLRTHPDATMAARWANAYNTGNQGRADDITAEALASHPNRYLTETVFPAATARLREELSSSWARQEAIRIGKDEAKAARDGVENEEFMRLLACEMNRGRDHSQ